MALSDYSGRAALTAVDLVNSYDVMTGFDALESGADLANLLAAHRWVVDRPVPAVDFCRLKALRPRLRFVFGNDDVAKSVAHLNALLREFNAQPQLTDHDGDWHWHYADQQASLTERVATTCVVTLLGAIADDDVTRLRVCAAGGCANVFIDASRPGSRRFCDPKSCGNKTHVYAYRGRQRSK